MDILLMELLALVILEVHHVAYRTSLRPCPGSKFAIEHDVIAACF